MSNIAITPGSGATIATTDVAGVSFQRVISAPEDSAKATYSATYKAQSAGTSATTNVITFAGSATKTVKVTRLLIGGTLATTAENWDVLINKQSTADTGGTAATAATIIKHNTSNAAATAVAPLFYTAAPTAGTVTGAIFASKIFLPVAPAVVPNLEVVRTNEADQLFTLNGVTDVLAVTFGAVTPGHASSIDVTVTWTEE